MGKYIKGNIKFLKIVNQKNYFGKSKFLVLQLIPPLYTLLGCYEISLGDTIGVGTPEKTHKMIQAIKNIPKEKLAAHFHDTYDKACDNLMAALEVRIYLETGLFN